MGASLDDRSSVARVEPVGRNKRSALRRFISMRSPQWQSNVAPPYASERRNARSLSSGRPKAGPGGLLRPTVLSVQHMTFQPRDHAQHDLFVVLLNHERMAVALNAGLGEDIDGDFAASGLEGFLECARGHHPVLCTVADHDED